MTWGLCTVQDAAGAARPAALRIQDGAVLELPVSYPSAVALLDDWDQACRSLRDFDASAAPVIEDARLLAPLLYPRKVFGAGANYRDHLMEMTGNEPPADFVSWFFVSPPTTTVVGPGAEVLISPDPEQKVDWEAELAVVMAHRVRDIDVDEVEQHVAGFMAVNDITARGLLPRTVFPAPPFAFDWIAAKSQDTFWPMGPAIVPAWLVPDPDDLAIRLWVNDEIKQDSSTSQLIIGWRRLVSDISRRITLEPGDVIATGTPAGVGMPKGTFLHHGDRVRVEITGLGTLDNVIVERGRAATDQ